MIVGVGNEDFDELINLYYFFDNININRIIESNYYKEID